MPSIYSPMQTYIFSHANLCSPYNVQNPIKYHSISKITVTAIPTSTSSEKYTYFLRPFLW